jgi:hypothetical protein
MKTILIIDKSGHTYFGEYLYENDDNITLINVVNLVYNFNAGNLESYMFPVVPPELLTEKSRAEGVIWFYSKDNARLVSQNVELESGLIDQYDKLFKQK